MRTASACRNAPSSPNASRAARARFVWLSASRRAASGPCSPGQVSLPLRASMPVCLPSACASPLHVQKVVLNLKRHAQRLRKALARRQLHVGRAGQPQARAHRAAEHVGGLVQMDVRQLLRAAPALPLARQIRALPRHHARHARRARQRGRGRHLRGRPAGGQHGLKGQRQQPVPGQNGHAFPVDAMVCGLSPSQVVVVHGGQIVMDEGIGVNHFHRAGPWHRLLPCAARRVAGGQQQHGAQAFAAGHEAVAHGAQQRFRRAAGRQGGVQRFLRRALPLRVLAVVVHASSCAPERILSFFRSLPGARKAARTA